MKIEELAKYFDHTALKAETTQKDIEKLCGEALKYNVATVCLNPVWLPLASKLLESSDVVPITVIGFPLGAMNTASKVFEARSAIEMGAKEIDMVLSVGLYRSGLEGEARNEIQKIQHACGDIPLKVIFETCYLTNKDVYKVAKWCAEDGVDFVKTSTGFGTRGASREDIVTINEAIDSVPGAITKIKASGGIRTLKDCLTMIDAGASRLGASATVQILEEFKTGKSNLTGQTGY
jgi:deoxyribose-phosphate aldolase